MRKALSILFWAGVLLMFLTPLSLNDFWWHLNTGRWIVEHGALPSTDPFSIIGEVPADKKFILSGYFLCQILLYALYAAFGLWGPVVFKAFLFVAIFFTLDRILAGYGLDGTIRRLILLPAILIATFYDEVRPQTFTFFFFAIALYLLERNRCYLSTPPGKATPPGGAGRSIWLLPPMMLLWANVHPEFVIGDAMLAVYAIYAASSKQPKRASLVPIILAIAASAVNPNGLEALSQTSRLLDTSIQGFAPSHEYLSPRQFSSLTGVKRVFPLFALFTACVSLSFIPKLKKGIERPDVLRMALFFPLAYFAMKTFRAGMFEAIVGTGVIGANIAPWVQDKFRPGLRAKAVAIAPAAAVLFIIAVLLPGKSILFYPVVNDRLFPVKTVDFLEREELPGNIYHPYEWGGYLGWRLYPRYKVFLDGRALGLMQEYDDVLLAKPKWKETLDRHGVDTVLYWPLQMFKRGVPPIIFALLKDDGWSPVYWDLRSVIFVRSDMAKRPIPKPAIWELLVMLLQANIKGEPGESRHYSALGEVYLQRGSVREAKEAFQKAVSLNPADGKASYYLKTLR